MLRQAVTRKIVGCGTAGAWRWAGTARRWAGTARRSGPVSPGGVGWCARRPCTRPRVVCVALTDNDALLGSGDDVP